MPRPCGWCSDAGPCVRHRPVTSVEPGCACGGMAACQQCQDRDAAIANTNPAALSEALEACREQRADLLALLEVEREQHADALRKAWHEGYGAGSSDATDGWLNPGSPQTSNPYPCVTSPGE